MLTKRVVYKFTPKKFGDRLKEIRTEDLDMSQTEFAVKLGIGKNSLCQYEKGDRTPNAGILRKMADALGCTADYLIGKEPAPTHENSDVCAWTGLSAESVAILHEGVKDDMIKAYSLLLDLFDYLLKQNKAYWYETLKELDNGEKGVVCYRADNDASRMMAAFHGAIEANFITLYGKITDEAEFRDLDDDDGNRLAKAGEVASKIYEAEQFLNSHGEVVLDSHVAEEYYLRKASDCFKDALKAFLAEKTKENPAYYLKEGWHPLIFGKEMFDEAQKVRASKSIHD